MAEPRLNLNFPGSGRQRNRIGRCRLNLDALWASNLVDRAVTRLSALTIARSRLAHRSCRIRGTGVRFLLADRPSDVKIWVSTLARSDDPMVEDRMRTMKGHGAGFDASCRQAKCDVRR